MTATANSSAPNNLSASNDVETQAAFHRQLFDGLYEWDELWQTALELVGDSADALELGLDQLGHFGPVGVKLVADRLVAAVSGRPRRIVELGSGFGGATRQMRRLLAGRDLEVSLLGVEFVPEHCELAAAVGRAVGDTDPLFIVGDVRRLPLASASADAVFAAGSASHFSDMGDVLAECHRVLRPHGVLVMTEEVSLRPADGPPVSAEFARLHPADIFPAATPERRLAELEAAGLVVEAFEPLAVWAASLLRQRVQGLRMMEDCSIRMFGVEAYNKIAATLAAAAAEYQRGSIEPTLVVARRATKPTAPI